jgi:carboxypeptidase D
MSPICRYPVRMFLTYFTSMTWGGVQGFQTAINQSNFVVPGFGPAAGNMHTERKLTYVEVVLSGHMVPQFSPWESGFTFISIARG